MTSRAVAASLYRCWKKHPRKNADLKKRSDHMQRCCNYLVFGDVVNQVTGEVTRKLQAAEFCRDRLCPMQLAQVAGDVLPAVRHHAPHRLHHRRAGAHLPDADHEELRQLGSGRLHHPAAQIVVSNDEQQAEP